MRSTLLFLLTLPLCAAPRLLLNPADVERIQKLAASEKWAADVRDELIRRAEDWPAAHVKNYGLKEWALPKEGGGWSHAYVCPDHGVRLTQKEGRNLCPIDGKDYHGWPIDNCAFSQRHGDTAQAARDLGLAWLLTGKRAFAEKARTIFNAYSALYPTLPIHDNQNRLDTKTGARVMSQTLSESSWIVPLVFGYDLVRDTLPPDERARFETEVLRNAAKVIARYDAGKSNWQSWHNAALLAVGLTVNDPALVKLALEGPGGFKFQMRASITPDGPWFEGSWGYHFFAFNPLMLTREMAARAGIALPEAVALKKMLDAPLKCVFPDGTLPNFNDTGMVRLANSAQHYEVGYRLWGDARYLPLVRGARRGVESLLWGAASLPAGESPALASEILPDAGLATLRAKNSDYTVAVKFGPHGGGHGHFDKLTFVSYANGAHLAADPGTQAYAAKTHATWDKLTVAHNTIVVDERTQEQATGRLIQWIPSPSATLIRLSAGPVYAAVEIERIIVHTAGYTLDIVDARSTDGKPHRFDWLYHNYGKVSTELALAPYGGFPKENGYQHLTETRGAVTSEPWQSTFTQANSNLRLRMLAAPKTTVVTGLGLGPDLRVPVPFAMARRDGTSAHFVALYEPFVGAPRVKSLRQSAPGVFVVETAAGTDEITIYPGEFTIKRN